MPAFTFKLNDDARAAFERWEAMAARAHAEHHRTDARPKHLVIPPGNDHVIPKNLKDVTPRRKHTRARF